MYDMCRSCGMYDMCGSCDMYDMCRSCDMYDMCRSCDTIPCQLLFHLLPLLLFRKLLGFLKLHPSYSNTVALTISQRASHVCPPNKYHIHNQASDWSKLVNVVSEPRL